MRRRSQHRQCRRRIINLLACSPSIHGKFRKGTPLWGTLLRLDNPPGARKVPFLFCWSDCRRARDAVYVSTSKALFDR